MPSMWKYLYALVAVSAITSECFADTSKQDQADSLSELVSTFNRSVKDESSASFKILKSIDFKSEKYDEINQMIKAKYTYPQAFEIKEKQDLLYVIRYSNSKPSRGVIEKYRWSSGEIISNYIITEPQLSISEGLFVEEDNGNTIAYFRSDNALTRYQLIDGAGGIGTTKKLEKLIENVAQSFYHQNGMWYVEKFKADKDSIGQSRGQYSVYDKSFNHVRDINFPPDYSGYRESQKLEIPKHQGFAVLSDAYVMSMGGYWTDTAPTTPYNYYGINIFDKNGEISASKYLAPSTMASKLSKLGVSVDRMENEGIQPLSDGSLAALLVVRSKGGPGGKLLFLGFNR